MEKKELKKLLLRTVKIAVGSSAAIYAAEFLHLEYAASAGSIALLTLATTKWETLKLSVFRVITFLGSAALAWLAFAHLSSERTMLPVCLLWCPPSFLRCFCLYCAASFSIFGTMMWNRSF